MSKISLKHSGGNVVSLNSPTNAPGAADVAFKLPNSDGSAGQFMKTDGSGNLSFDAVSAGVTTADQWYLTSTFQGSVDPVQNNLSRYTSAGNLGSAMTVSSGIWTFPSTGFWKIDVSVQIYRASGHQSAYNQWRTILSTDNFSSSFVGATADAGYFDNYSATRFAGGSSSVIFDVTNVSTHKLKFLTNVQDNATWSGDATNPHTMFQFVRLGDT